MHKSFKRLLAVGLMSIGLPLTLLAGTASAATAPHSPIRPAVAIATLDNTDPGDTGCWDSNAYVVHNYHAPIYDRNGDYLGYVENWFSPDCGTNWSETFVAGGVTATVTVWTTRGTYSTDHYTALASYAWSNQVYAPGTTVACAQGAITVAGNHSGSNSACF